MSTIDFAESPVRAPADPETFIDGAATNALKDELMGR